MPLVLLLIILALIFGGVGIFVEGLAWLLIIALVLVLIGGVLRYGGRNRPL